MTNCENIHFWMKTVHSIYQAPEDVNDKVDLLPMILSVASHFDLLGDSAEQAKEGIIQQLVQELDGKLYALLLAGQYEGLEWALWKHYIFIANKCKNPAEIVKLHDAVFELSQPILSKEQPVIYLKADKGLFLIQEGVINTKEFHAVTQECGFLVSIDSKEFNGALEHFHNRGIALNFPTIKSLQNLVFLFPDWLTKLLSYFLLAHSYQNVTTSRYNTSHLLLIENSILLESYLENMLEAFNKSECEKGTEVQEAIDLMKTFDSVAEISIQTYFLEKNDAFCQEDLLIVPSLVAMDTHNEKWIPNEGDPKVMVVYYDFPGCFILPNIYNSMVAECINWNTENHKDINWFVSCCNYMHFIVALMT